MICNICFLWAKYEVDFKTVYNSNIRIEYDVVNQISIKNLEMNINMSFCYSFKMNV